MSQAAVAERYARAIFELGVETGQLEVFTSQVRDIAAAYSVCPELRHVLEDPLIVDEQRHAVLRALAQRLGAEQGGFQRLTPREREVLQLIAEGHTNAAIAGLLSVSVKTVEKHRANLMSKLNVHDVASLTRLAIKHGLVFLEE